MTSQPPPTTTATAVEQPQKAPAQVVPVTETAPADLAGQNSSNGMPQGYSARTVKNPDDIPMKHAGLLRPLLPRLRLWPRPHRPPREACFNLVTLIFA